MSPCSGSLTRRHLLRYVEFVEAEPAGVRPNHEDGHEGRVAGSPDRRERGGRSRSAPGLSFPPNHLGVDRSALLSQPYQRAVSRCAPPAQTIEVATSG